MIFDDLFTAIQKMTLMTNTGATVPIPINWADFQKVKTRIATFMEVS